MTSGFTEIRTHGRWEKCRLRFYRRSSDVKENWDWLVEKAEEGTGESYGGLEPLLTKEEVIDVARDIYNDNDRGIEI